MYRIPTLILFSFVVSFGFGQSTSTLDDERIKEIQKIPLESVFVHFNGSLFFSGERLKYKFYCFDNSTKKASKISKMGYVSLVAKDGSSVFRQKIVLEAGLGNSDFFIPTSVSTGSYKLIAFSNGMKNAGTESFFKSDVQIINPYEKLPENHIASPPDSLDNTTKNVASKKAARPKRNGDNNLLTIMVDKPNSGTREEVKLKIDMVNGFNASGNYSLSVRKIDAFSSPSKISSKEFLNDFLNKSKISPENFKGYIPELRGELISGNIKNKKTDQPAKNQRISLSLPGKNYVHKIATSNEMGEFHFNLSIRYDNSTAVLQVLSENWEDYDIQLYDSVPRYDNLEFYDFRLSSEMEKEILERSIHNQIENAYQQVKQDSTPVLNYGDPFYRNFFKTYFLDDYTRFNSLQETIIEVIDQVSTRNTANGERVFAVRPEIGVPNTILPMVFVDGLFIKRHQDILGISANRFKSISFSKELFVLGAQTFQGVLHFETMTGNFYEDFKSPHHVKIDLFRPQRPKKYYFEKYDSQNSKKQIPDYRHQLLWQPNLALAETSTEVSFFTSDLKGQFEISLEGFTLQGTPVSLVKTFNVE